MSSQQAIHYGRGSHANAIHFYQQIQPHELQDEELRIRRSFVERYWKGVSNPILLRLPNGSEWKMFWVKRGDDIWLQKNWKSFARSLRSGDQLVFKHKGESNFKIIIFDDSALEIDYSSIRCNVDEDTSEHYKEESDECVEIKNKSKKPTQPLKEEKINSNEELKSISNPHLEANNNGKKRKINMDSEATHQNVSEANSSSGGKVKKAKKASRTEAFKERARKSHPDENPSFTLKLSRTYAEGDRLRIPSWFSKKYLNELEGTAGTINSVGEERTWKVNLTFDDANKNFTMRTGWKSFSQEHNLQVGDVCKFEMTQRKPVSFIITITRARGEEQLQGFGQEANQGHQDKSEKMTVDKSRSCRKTHGLQNSESPNMKLNTFMASVESLDKLSVPTEFMKRHKIRNGNSVEMKVGGKSWSVEVSYYPHLGSWGFSKGWQEFVRGCSLMVGDTCLFEMIDEENLVFKVSILLDV